MFKELVAMIDHQLAYSIYKIGFVSPEEMDQTGNKPKNIQLKGASDQSSLKSPMESDSGLTERQADKILKDSAHYNGDKIGRNDPCPCGSGKKYKRCCGR